MKIINKLNLPEGLSRAVSVNRHNDPGCLSATTLIQGVKQIILTERHWDSLEDDVSERIWAVFGSAVHSLLESEGENDFTEQEMSCKIGDVTVTGRIDSYDMERGVICDYKTASVYKIKCGNFDDWYKQGMIYAWLLTRNGFNASKCRFIAMLKDHSKTEAKRDCGYPQSPVYIYEFSVSAQRLKEIENYIARKVEDYCSNAALPDDSIPACSPEEHWDRPSKFAVRKEGRKTAIRLYDSLEDAESHRARLGEGHFVEHRKGESIKCRSYCLCARFCGFYQDNAAVKTIAPTLKNSSGSD